MSKIKFYFIFLIAAVAVSSCNKDDDNDIEVTPPKPYAEQYAIDSLTIDNYLKTSYISEIVNKPGFPEDQDITIKKILSGENYPSLWSYLNSSTLPRLTFRSVLISGVNYKIYTLLVREGLKNAGQTAGGEYPCNVDAVFAGYKGTLMDETGTVFDSSNNGQKQWELDGSTGIIRGWSEAFPQFKTGWVSSKSDGTISYNDFGVGVMFLPSALGYYNQAQDKIPAYSPLVFSIKLYALKRFDQDADGVPSYQEDMDDDRYVSTLVEGVLKDDDTDKDGIPNFLDFDDDGDGYATRGEVKKADGTYYAFEDIPDCDGKIPADKNKKRHLDKDCHKMSQ
ncbi:FKBP-type peptidyl-prolyl cis-trans isomerase [Flavobacterium aestuarii]|uniref:FKBP-type peptidyl-prolyl cis-trans isomerase n=1 Tax=Flavobacterium aestuarii TaxID=3149227 RepID=UPI0032B3F184